jgi:serine protease AprX
MYTTSMTDSNIPAFTSNHPFARHGENTLLPIVERTGGLPAYTGKGVTIAFIDAGFYPHPDLKDRILVHADASTNRVVEQVGEFDHLDLSWHGQMTSFIAAGDGRTSKGKYRGLASAASLVLVKVSTPKGSIKERDILRGLRWVIDTHKRFNIKVVNISVGGDDPNLDPALPLHRAVRKLTAAGVTVVIAAGNRNVDFLVPPASAGEAITVGGYDDSNTLESAHWKLYRHNYGHGTDGTRKPDLIAPAAWIASPIMPGTSVEREARWLAPLLASPTSAFLTKLVKRGHSDLGLDPATHPEPDDKLYRQLQQRIHAHKIVDPYHQHVDGTSVAAPIVASVIAQMLEANPGLTPAQIRAILTRTAQPLPHVPMPMQGAGRLNAAGAVQAALELT